MPRGKANSATKTISSRENQLRKSVPPGIVYDCKKEEEADSKGILITEDQAATLLEQLTKIEGYYRQLRRLDYVCLNSHKKQTFGQGLYEKDLGTIKVCKRLIKEYTGKVHAENEVRLNDVEHEARTSTIYRTFSKIQMRLYTLAYQSRFGLLCILVKLANHVIRVDNRFLTFKYDELKNRNDSLVYQMRCNNRSMVDIRKMIARDNVQTLAQETDFFDEEIYKTLLQAIKRVNRYTAILRRKLLKKLEISGYSEYLCIYKMYGGVQAWCYKLSSSVRLKKKTCFCYCKLTNLFKKRFESRNNIQSQIKSVSDSNKCSLGPETKKTKFKAPDIYSTLLKINITTSDWAFNIS